MYTLVARTNRSEKIFCILIFGEENEDGGTTFENYHPPLPVRSSSRTALDCQTESDVK